MFSAGLSLNIGTGFPMMPFGGFGGLSVGMMGGSSMLLGPQMGMMGGMMPGMMGGMGGMMPGMMGGMGGMMGGMMPGMMGGMGGMMGGGMMQMMMQQMQMMMMGLLMLQMMQQSQGGGGNPYTGLYPGYNLPNLGGGGGGFPGMPYGGGAFPFGGSPLSPNGSGQSAVDLGRRFLGQNAWDIKGLLPNFTRAGGQTNNCADFVSSLLESTGRIKGHHINVGELEQSLLKQGYVAVPADQMQAGDVWISNSRGHTELVTGKNRTIGSNNDRPGHQVISEHYKTPGTGVIYRLIGK